MAPVVNKPSLLVTAEVTIAGVKVVSHLSCPAPAPRSRCIGEQVARFARPFESRPVETVRRELYRRLAAKPGGISSTSGWVAPAAPLPISPILLAGGTEDGTPTRVPRPKGKQSRKC